MNKSLQIGLKAKERIYINGAVIRVDRKVTLELLNDVAFLLESHVMRPEQTATPLRQLYFMVQTMLIDTAARNEAFAMFERFNAQLITVFRDPDILGGLERASDLVRRERLFEALRVLRGLFAAEDALISKPKAETVETSEGQLWQ